MILIADDHKDTCAAIRGLLHSEGLATACVHNGRDALAAINHERPEMLVLDMMMPGMGGAEVLRTLRANPATADLPVVVFSATANDQDLDEVRAMGADVLVKGMADWGDFACVVRAHLKDKNPMRQVPVS